MLTDYIKDLLASLIIRGFLLAPAHIADRAQRPLLFLFPLSLLPHRRLNFALTCCCSSVLLLALSPPFLVNMSSTAMDVIND